MLPDTPTMPIFSCALLEIQYIFSFLIGKAYFFKLDVDIENGAKGKVSAQKKRLRVSIFAYC